MRTLCIRISELDYSRMKTCAHVEGVSISQIIRAAIAERLRDNMAGSAGTDLGSIELKLSDLADELHDLVRITNRLHLLICPNNNSQP